MDDTSHNLLTHYQSDHLFVDGDFPVDPNVVAAFPDGTKIISAHHFGASSWTKTARIRVQFPDELEAKYFLKCATKDHGRMMMEGEFNAMSELYKWAPHFVPKPHAWGKYSVGNPETYFLLSQFVDMHQRVPDPKQLCTKLANLHRQSTSSNGLFGMHVVTCQGRQPQFVDWEKSWTVFFRKLLQHVARVDLEINGKWAPLEKLEQRIFSHVIDRLIGNLERDGRTVKPCLIHADLWEGNTGTSYETGNIYIFDSAAFYAHNEMEIGNWRCHYNKIHDRIYTKTYLKKYGPSEPKEEWEDRNRMYSIYYNVIYSCNHKLSGKAVRQTAYDDMYFLIDKYAPFAERQGPPRLKISEYATLSAERDHTIGSA